VYIGQKTVNVWFHRGVEMNKIFRAIIITAVITLMFSSLMDAYLWVTKRFMVPSFVISGMSIGAALLVMAIMKLLDSMKTYDEALDHLVKRRAIK
jgi:hypothetical protein